MHFLNNDLRKWALDSFQSVLDIKLPSAIASFAACSMIFDQWTALSVKASTFLSNQFPLKTTNSASHKFDWSQVRSMNPLRHSTDWSQIQAYSHLQWHGCFEDFKCARLQVPMDWQGTTRQSQVTVELALIKLEATVPITHQTYGGIVVLNPGGPGGSGVGQVLRGGHAVRTILSAGPEQNNHLAKNFDIIGFDPRGVNNTTPMLSCFADDIEAGKWESEKHAIGYIGDTDTSFDQLWTRMRAFGDSCSTRAAEHGFGYHMSTTSVARDIVEIFERHGQWREAETERLLKTTSLNKSQHDAVISRNIYNADREKIQFWGFSYGTVIGTHLLAMYPERIGRMVLDGVVDADLYRAGDDTTDLQDTDMAFVSLLEYCFEAGQDLCPIWNKGGPTAILDDVYTTLARFQQEPITVPGNATHDPTVVTYHDYESFVYDGVYNMLRFAPQLVQALHELSDGKADTIHAHKLASNSAETELTEACLKDGSFSASCRQVNSDASHLIHCSEIDDMTKRTKNEYAEIDRFIIDQSSLIGAVWSEALMSCTAWQTKTAWRYNGDFKSEPAKPALFIGNAFDPVTPLSNAVRMASNFVGSGLLQQNSEGHCSYGSVSMCTGKAIRAYFQDAMLPEILVGDDIAICEADNFPLQNYNKDKMPTTMEAENDTELWTALVTLNQIWP
ncbi:hypothetical protein MRB53_041178 [Persea americana]|nr:hypothetical protein MRB53_041178 [Persea americana]